MGTYLLIFIWAYLVFGCFILTIVTDSFRRAVKIILIEIPLFALLMIVANIINSLPSKKRDKRIAEFKQRVLKLEENNAFLDKVIANPLQYEEVKKGGANALWLDADLDEARTRAASQDFLKAVGYIPGAQGRPQRR